MNNVLSIFKHMFARKYDKESKYKQFIESYKNIPLSCLDLQDALDLALGST